MSTAAVMLVKDEADLIEPILLHLLAQVDQVLVADNLSTDGTSELLADLAARAGGALLVSVDEEVGYYQSRKTTALALRALELGHRWVIPCDADEVWLAPEGRRLADWLSAVGGETQFVKALIYNHVCTAEDPPVACPNCDGSGYAFKAEIRVACSLCGGRVEPNPLRRIGWRHRMHLDKRWGKVACRLRPDLEIHQGNHSASTHGIGTTVDGLTLRHFPYRGPEHFTRKAVNGYAAYRAAPDLDEGMGLHWKAYGQRVEEGGPEAGAAWFLDAFWSAEPRADSSLVYDPAPLSVFDLPPVAGEWRPPS